MTIPNYVELFAGGAGGWSLAAQRMGLAGTGIELDHAACLTRKANGLRSAGVAGSQHSHRLRRGTRRRHCETA